MGKTNRQEPRNGQFKRLKSDKKRRNKKQRNIKASLQLDITFVSQPKLVEFIDESYEEFETVDEMLRDLHE